MFLSFLDCISLAVYPPPIPLPLNSPLFIVSSKILLVKYLTVSGSFLLCWHSSWPNTECCRKTRCSGRTSTNTIFSDALKPGPARSGRSYSALVNTECWPDSRSQNSPRWFASISAFIILLRGPLMNIRSDSLFYIMAYLKHLWGTFWKPRWTFIVRLYPIVEVERVCRQYCF